MTISVLERDRLRSDTGEAASAPRVTARIGPRIGKAIARQTTWSADDVLSVAVYVETGAIGTARQPTTPSSTNSREWQE